MLSPYPSGTCRLAGGLDAHRAGAEIDDLQQATQDHDVLEEIDHLILIGEVPMKENGGRQAIQSQYDRNGSDAIAQQEKGRTTPDHETAEPRVCWFAAQTVRHAKSQQPSLELVAL